MKLVKKTEYKAWREKNTDPYGNCCFLFAEAWAEEMERAMTDGKSVAEVARPAATIADKKYGITGFMYGVAVSILAKHWEYGEALRRWHNLDTQIGNEGEKANERGTVLNPALLSVGTKEA